jgi:DNA-binding CsgD family transcriptional regulator
VLADKVITVRGEDELAARAGHLFAGVRAEFICAATDMNTWSQPRSRPTISTRMRAGITGGLVVRKLYTPAALAAGEQRRHLLGVAATGAQVRICGARLPHETIIIDRRVMILAGATEGGSREFTVTTSPALIAGIRALFEATWDTAADLTAYLRRDLPQIGPAGLVILEALAAGHTDEAAARRLGISLRTYRRRVAELMRMLESDSRFQAGLRAGALGLARQAAVPATAGGGRAAELARGAELAGQAELARRAEPAARPAVTNRGRGRPASWRASRTAAWSTSGTGPTPTGHRTPSRTGGRGST